jgi:Ca2+-binding RTX toxin-like protein
VLNHIGVDVRTLDDVDPPNTAWYAHGYPGAGSPGSLYTSLPTLLGSSAGPESARIVASENLVAGIAVLGRDSVDDTLIGTQFADWLYGEQLAADGATWDTVSYERSDAAVSVNLGFAAVTGSGGDAQGDRLTGIENLIGSAHGDILVGGDGRTRLEGGDGNDVLEGGGGNDTLSGGNGGDAVDGGQGVDTILGGAGHDYLLDDTGAGSLLSGGDGSDILNSNAVGVTLSGGAGNDYIAVGEADSAQTIHYAEGDGFDLTYFFILGFGNRLVIEGDITGFVVASNVHLPTRIGEGSDLLVRVGDDAIYMPLANDPGWDWDAEWVAGPAIVASNGSWTLAEALTAAVYDPAAIAALDLDSTGVGASAPGGDMTGGSGADHLVGWGLSDDLDGVGGNDTLTGAGRDDSLNGGAGDDTLYGGTGGDTLTGGNGNDSILGENGDDTVLADGGSDSIDSGAGQDWIDAAAASSTVNTIDLMQQKLVGIGGQDVLLSIEHIQGSDYGEGVIGDDGANSLFGNAGADHVWANGGRDEAWGGDGNDDLHGGAGNDSLWGDWGDDTVDGQWGDDVLEGGGGGDSLIGGSGADRFVFSTFEGEDTVQDFAPGTDELELWVDNTTAAQVLAAATVSGTDTLLHLYQTEIRLVGVAPNQLTLGDIVIPDDW